MITTNELKKKLRDWHIWLGIIVSFPLTIISATTIIFAFANPLNLDNYFISTKYFPGYWGEKNEKKNELKSFYKDEHGNEYFGYKFGLLVKNNEHIENIEFFDKQEIRVINKIDQKLIVGTKKGLFLKQKNEYKNIINEEIFGVYVYDNESFITSKIGFYRCDRNFIQCNKNEIDSTETVQDKVSLKKLNVDLHTGKAIFGKSLEWLWQTILGLCLLFFVFSGCYLWVKKKFRK